jgi:ribosomal protein S18 acetylase RimI-like enzyme
MAFAGVSGGGRIGRRAYRAALTSGSMPPSSLSFGFAGPGDVELVVDLVQSAYRGEHSRRGWTTEADLLDGQRIDTAMLAKAIATAGTVIVLARSDDQLLGCCQLHSTAVPPPTDMVASNGEGERRTIPGRIAMFGMFAVDPDHQGTGVGSQVLAEAERIASADWGMDRIELTVIDVRDELIAWYRRRGYEPTGETRPFPHEDERLGLPRRKDLQFMVMQKPLTR